jgi:hypothetical protein
MRMTTNRLFAMCLAAVCLTFVVSSVSVGGESCGDKAVKASGSSCCPAMQVAKTDGSSAVEAAAREYLAKVTKIGSVNNSQGCPGAAAMKGLMAVLSEDEAYRPMVAQFEASMKQQPGGQTVAMVKTDCSQPCDGAKTAALASGRTDCGQPCDGAKNAALASGTTDCSKSCDSAKTAALASGTTDCSMSCDVAKNAALASGKTDCSKSCDSASMAALAGAKTGDCCGSCGAAAPANYLTFGCTKCDDLARTAAEAYLSMMMEIKKVTGVEGCPLEAANLTLAAVMHDMQNATQANSGTGTTTVSLGSVSEKKGEGCSKPCEAVTKK